MAQAIALKAEERQGTGTGVARALRREGKIPGIIYGGKNEPQPIAVDLKAVNAEIQKPGFFSRVYSVEIDKTKVQVIARDIQFHPVTDVALHVDFQRVDKDSKINVSVPVEYINEDKAPGLTPVTAKLPNFSPTVFILLPNLIQYLQHHLKLEISLIS